MAKAALPVLIAGPILRHVDEQNLNVWLVTTAAYDMQLHLSEASNGQASAAIDISQCDNNQHTWQVGKHAFIHLVSISGQPFITPKTLYEYDLSLVEKNSAKRYDNLHQAGYKGFYGDATKPNFRYNDRLSQVIHGSCRKAHFSGDDALPILDLAIQQEFESGRQRPDMILMTGDQVYIDDVAGPMLNAIHQVIALLGLQDEKFEGATVGSLSELIKHKDGYYQREALLPEIKANDDLANTFFKAKRKPVFTSVNAQNHLIALSEMLALYFLSWSPVLWRLVNINQHCPNPEYQDKYNHELLCINNFKTKLDKVQRALAHIPSYMIFDDHDVTDDWNLTRGWEEQVYGHPFSKRIIGNALTAYFLCQGCGNPKADTELLFEAADKTFANDTRVEFDGLQTLIFEFDQWHYQLDTHPPVHVLDTRTQRWRSESSLNKPSGLMDWEALCDLQAKMIGKDAVIMVSAAPVYGVKFIETVQRIFTVFGGALVVDAENWMAHRGTASVMLNIFRHIKTPPNFIILSGDVHYSFVYDVKLRFRRNSPTITQFTSSGIHNEFPPKLLRWFDRLNTWFYGRNSPLNWLTKRRNMSVRQRHPIDYDGYLVNHANLGKLKLNHDASEVHCELMCSDGKVIKFEKKPTDNDS